jgi:hypothetical protein
MRVDGSFYADWSAHTGLIFNPKGSSQVDLSDLTNNRFITFGQKNFILVSADGVNYHKASISWPKSLAADYPVFVSMEKTPFGYHILSGNNWDNKVGVRYIRHLYSKNLVDWKVLERDSGMNNPNHYKGAHLRYEAKTKRLWSFAPCGYGKNNCSYLGWLKAKEF